MQKKAGFPYCLDKLNELAGLSVGIMALLMAIFVTYDVILRYLMNTPSMWVTEVSTYMMGYITFMGAAYALSEGAHVGVDLITTRVGIKARKWFGIAANLINFLVIAFFIRVSFGFWWDAYKYCERSWGVLSVPLAFPYFFFLLGMVLLLITLMSLLPKIFNPPR
ncbi:MAG: TRAP transporter small permease subunit [Eubacteriales bacterium]